ncbi:SDR family NAD(P)-dependent oxidoreductase [Peterkaempfera bronchialis]|uniref:SDR family NAD(P)-dependent oxidoreductase n=1 Tax=Peterkaempfera bronchialis TaxID=2126346 RepID=UPI003C2D9FA4
MDAHTHDPADLIAIVGMAGRFPGAPDADSLWTLMMERGDAIRPVPADRWDTSRQIDPEKQIQGVGGFIDGVDLFDAGFFGISPREAAAIDPQQRLLLEVGWRALEDAGQPAAALAGTRTGVYVGASWHDYELLRIERSAQPTPHSLVGNALDVIAARLSYVLGLRGPSMAVETGCSSSLVALHLAAQALRQGEIEAAVVGGTNLMLNPHVTVGLTHFGGLSPEGRCKAFSATADGFVRGEGVAALYLKTMQRALADGDRIHGVVVRTVVNNDGGGDSLVTPSPDGQEDLLRRAYTDGTVPYGAPAYIEAHGTGTGRGDPIEATALARVLGSRRPADSPLYIGSVKTNIGHLEAGAGMAGLFKLLLALRHRTVPPSLHSAELNPAIPFDELNVRVARDPLPLPATGPVYVGVNSFGWGGTNAHVVLMSPPEQATEEPSASAPTGLPTLVPLSAKDRTLLAEHARQLAPLAPAEASGVAAFAGTLAWRRDHFPARAALVAGGPEELRTALEAVAGHPEAQPEVPGVVTGQAVPRGRTAFVFPGQGSQWSGMGRELYRDSPLFAEVIARCAEALRPHTEWNLLDIFSGDAGDEWTTRIDMLQPTLWAMSLGLAELWRASGVEPDVVLGHSQGEITAATLAGILSYEDAALVMARRSAIARRTSGHGRMLAVDLDREAALAALEGFEDSVSLAVHNGPSSCVLSGEKDAVLMLRELLEAEGTYCRLVNVDYASHSPQMDPLHDDLLEALAPARPRAGTIDLMSTVRVRPLAGPEMDAAYWVENLRSPVLFADTMGALLDGGVTHVVEISPHPVLAPAMDQLVAGRAEPAVVLTTLRRNQGSPGQMALALARGYAAGLEPFGGLPRRALLPLPGHPLRPDRYWTAERPRGSGAARGFETPLVPAPDEPGTWHGALELSVADLPWLADHQVYGTAVLPGAGMLTLAVNTVRTRIGTGPRRLEKVAFRKEVALGDSAVRLTAEWCADLPEGGSFRLLSLPEGATAWELNATARADHRDLPYPPPEFPDWAASEDPVGTGEFYRVWAERGLEYGPAFQGVRELYTHPAGDRALGEVVLPDRLRAGNRPHVLHPALWDGTLQVCLALCGEYAAGAALMPTAVRRIELLGDPEEPITAVWSHAVRRGEGLLDVYVFDAARRPLVAMESLELRPLPGADGAATSDAQRLHRIEWSDVTADPESPAAATSPGTSDSPGTAAAPAARAPGRWVVHGDGAFCDDLVRALAAAGADASRSATGSEAVGVPDGVVFVAPPAEAGPEQQQYGLSRLTDLVGSCADSSVPPRLAVVTEAAQAARADDVPDPGAALYWGYSRVLRREHAELAPRVIDLDPADPDRAQACAAELLGDDTEDQVALRHGHRLAARLSRGEPAAEQAAGLPPLRARRQPFRVGTIRPGSWDGVAWLPLVRRAPGPGEIEVEVTAAAVDRDQTPAVLAGAAPTAGSFAGRVVAVGPEVTAFSLGDSVAACAPGAPASHVTVRVDHARAVPEGLGDAEAAVLPLALATAWYALADLGRLEAGETVLVLGAGVVGLAAAQIARVLGARVLATADGDVARGHLGGLGVDEIFDSRDPSSADRVRRATADRGVDLVLGFPADAATTGLEALAEDGRLVVLGSGGFRGGHAVTDALRKGAALIPVDVPGLLDRRPHRFARVLDAAWDLVADGKLDPLPIRPHTFAEAADALREAAGGDRVEQVVLVGPSTVQAVVPVPMPDGRFRADASYLITGGLGALGLSLAGFLAEHGAGTLVLMGRSAPSPEAAERLAALRGQDVRVEVVRCDVGDADAVRRALDAVRDRVPPLRGVVHAAGLLDDATIRTMTPQQVAAVLAPKIGGARHLDAATADDPLDFFVLFSSAAALVGNAGQAAYAAANAALDAFAEARRRRGLPALSVQWGPFAEIGLAVRGEQRGARLEERGMGSFPAHEAWSALVRMLGRDEPVTGYVPIDLRRWFDAYPDTAALGSWQLLHGAARDGDAGGASGGEFLARLLRTPPEDRAELAEQKVRELAGRVLRLAPERVERETPFKALGLDSLMSLELRNRLESAFGIRLSPTLLWAYGNARALSGALCGQLPTAEQGG